MWVWLLIGVVTVLCTNKDHTSGAGSTQNRTGETGGKDIRTGACR